MKKIYACLIVSLFLLGTALPVALALGEARTGSDDVSDTRTSGTTIGRDIETSGHGGSWSEDFDDQGPLAEFEGTRYIEGKVQLVVDPLSWTKEANNPVLTTSPGKFDSDGLRQNYVMYEDGMFKMWYGGYDGSNNELGYATSLDGVNWVKENNGDPVLSPGGGWESVSVFMGHVINDGGTYKMWYWAAGGGTSKIGYATSSDGIVWNKYGSNPVFSADGSGFDSTHTFQPWVMKDGSTYKLWYAGNSGTGMADRIGYATSADGITWNRQANPVLTVGGNGKFDDFGVGSPVVLKEDDGYIMYYSGHDGADMGIGVAISKDGIQWTKLNNGNAVIDHGAGAAWDNSKIIEHSLIKMPYRYLLWYGGGPDNYNCRIGLAVAKDLNTTGTMISEQIDLPPGMEWDLLSLKKAEPLSTGIRITVLDATTSIPIAGLTDRTEDQFDISSLNDQGKTSIKLKATFTGPGTATPSLYTWGVGWTAADTWRDPFIRKQRSSMDREAWWRNGEVVLDADITTWTRSAQNPILSEGAGWESNGVQNPFVIHDGTQYVLNYGGCVGPGVCSIGRATSNDGLTWTRYGSNPIISMGGPGSWSDSGIWAGVWTLNVSGHGEYKAWYGASDGSEYRIGHTVSGDGLNWMEDPDNPIVDDSGGGSWDDDTGAGVGGTAGPKVIFLNGTYHLYYHGITPGDYWEIGYAYSQDGVTFTKPANSKVISMSNNKFDSGACLVGDVIYRRDEFYMFYGGTTGPGHTPGKIGYATSTDGATWTKGNNGDHILSNAGGSAWDATKILYPSIIFEDGIYKMWYTGYREGNPWKIGYAESDFYTNANVTSEVITLPSNGLWDDLAVGKDEPAGGVVQIDVLDGVTGQVVVGFDDLTGTVVDISGIDANDHPSIRLRAHLIGNGKTTPVLEDWAVNWTYAKVEQTAQIPDVSFLEDTFGNDLLDLTQYFDHARFGADGLTYTIASNSDPAHILGEMDVDDIHLDFASLIENWTGLAEFTVNATDGFMTLTSNSFTVTVEPVNDPPVWGLIPKQWLEGNSTYDDLLDLGDHVSDVDNDISDMTFSLEGSSDTGNLTVNVDAVGTVDFETYFDFEGDITITVAVNDTVDQVQTTFEVHINESGKPPENRPPEITSDPVTGATVGEEYKYQVWAQDPDRDALVYMLDLAPEGMVIHPLTGLITWTPTDDQTGLVPVTVNVSDVKGLYDLQDYTIFVTTPNKAPVFLSEPPATVRVGEEWLYNPKVDDPDSLFVFVFMESGPAGMEIDLLGTELIWRPGEDQLGDHAVVIYATDLDLSTYQNFTITVLPFNKPPTLSMISDQEVTVGQTFIYTVIASDPDNDTLQYNIQKGPTGVMVDDSGTISWIPDKDDVGGHSVTINVTDGEFTVSETFVINVLKKEKKPGHQETGDWLWLILLVIVIAVVVVAVIVLSKRRPPEPEEMAGPGAGYGEPPPPRAPEPEPEPGPGPEPELLEEEPVSLEELEEGPEAGPSGEDATVAAILAKAGPEKDMDKEKMKTIEIDGSSYTKTDILKRLTSLPRGLPSGLWGKDMDDLAEEVINAKYSDTPEGDLIMKIGRKHYYGDPKELGTYMQAYKGSIIKDGG